MYAARIHLVLLGLLPSLGQNLVSASSLRTVIARDVTCYFDIQADAGETCDNMSASWGISVQEFTKLNPGVTCPNLQASKSYCVVGEYTDDGEEPFHMVVPMPMNGKSSRRVIGFAISLSSCSSRTLWRCFTLRSKWRNPPSPMR